MKKVGKRTLLRTVEPGEKAGSRLHFRTALTDKIFKGTARGEEVLMRTPMKHFGELEELVGAAIFLASDAASFVTGSILAVDGGYLASGVNQ